MPPDDLVRLRHILDAAEQAVAYAAGRQSTDLRADDIATHGLVRLVEIIGEAAARVKPVTRAEFPSLPWATMIGMRNRVVHGYYDVSLAVIWSTVTEDLPPLITELKRHLSPPA